MLNLPDSIADKRFFCLYEKSFIYHDSEGRNIDHVVLSASNDKKWLKCYIEKYENWAYSRGFVWEGQIEGEPKWTIGRKLLTATGCESNQMIFIPYIAKAEMDGYTMKDVQALIQKAQQFLMSRYKVITTLYEERGDLLNIRLELFNQATI